jgi:hypothetical protein
MLVASGIFRERRRGRRWSLDPAWLFEQAYLDDRPCTSIAAEAGHPVRSVVEIVRRLADRLQGRLLRDLALPPDVADAIMAKAPVCERVREQILDALQAYVEREMPDDDLRAGRQPSL